MPNEFIEIDGSRLRYNFHEGQQEAWDSKRRIVAVLAGTQGGKTCFGPPWLYREIQQCGPGDYIIATPTFRLLELKALPEFRNLFEDILSVGTYKGSPTRVFQFSDVGQKLTFGDYGREYRTNIFFGHAMDPESLESATGKAAWLDEAGQKKFRLGAYEAVQRRLAIHQGRILITTTLYSLGWLKQQIWDRWKAKDPSVDVIRFESIQNPVYPIEEFERARRTLPNWKFNMFYRAIFERPAGLIYDSFNEDMCKVPRFAVPPHWPRYLGLDFGGVNTAGLFYAEHPESKQLFLYREYKAGSRTAEDHAKELLKGEQSIPYCVGGSKSEGQWRREFAAGGLAVREPDISDVEVGIDRVYGAHKQNQIYVFDDLSGYLDEKLTYSRELDEAGEPTEKIENKNDFHFMDAERYIIGKLRSNVQGSLSDVPQDEGIGHSRWDVSDNGKVLEPLLSRSDRRKSRWQL